MKNPLVIGLLLIGVIYTLFTFMYSPSIGELVAEDPASIFGSDFKTGLEPGLESGLQTGVTQTEPYSRRTIQLEDYVITPLADVEITAKVLGKENYWMGRESDISPVDLALGWGKMSDPAVLDHITISQSSRWYYWKTPKFPIPRREIETQSANMHIIPANDYVRENLKAVEEGQHVKMRGNLVRVDANDGWFWKSSLTRNDTGNHACELVYVTDMAYFQ